MQVGGSAFKQEVTANSLGLQHLQQYNKIDRYTDERERERFNVCLFLILDHVKALQDQT